MVDAGDLLWKSSKLPTARLAQQRVKAALQIEAYAHGGIDAMVPGEADFALGLDWLAAQAAAHELPYVASNISCEGFSIPGERVVERGGMTLGFVGVVGTENGGPCQVRSAVPALQSAIGRLGAVDLVVLLSHQKLALDADLVRALPVIDVVVNGHGRKAMNPPGLLGGQGVQLSTGTRGKKVGIARIELVSGASGFEIEGVAEKLVSKIEAARTRMERTSARIASAKSPKGAARAQSRLDRLSKQLETLEAERVAAEQVAVEPRHRIKNRLKPLNEDIVDHPHVQKLVAAAKPKIDAAAGAGPPASNRPAAFVGDRSCLPCHAEQHAQWKSTPHAYAWSTLEEVNRSGDLDCWSCHVTGAHHDQGPQHPSQVRGLENVGCESCHGPGATHVAAPATNNIRRDPGEKTCTQCHDGVKDEGRFEYPDYLRKVEH